MIPTTADSVKKVTVTCKTDRWPSKQKEERVYCFTRNRQNVYSAVYSAGQKAFTKEDSGPCGEPIIGTVEWGLPYIDNFQDWEDVIAYLKLVRAVDVEYTME